VDVVHFSLESIEEVFAMKIDRISYLVHDFVNVLIHLFKVLINFILFKNIMIELLLCSNSELLCI
jgi:hypothetical protein